MYSKKEKYLDNVNNNKSKKIIIQKVNETKINYYQYVKEQVKIRRSKKTI